MKGKLRNIVPLNYREQSSDSEEDVEQIQDVKVQIQDSKKKGRKRKEKRSKNDRTSKRTKRKHDDAEDDDDDDDDEFLPSMTAGSETEDDEDEEDQQEELSSLSEMSKELKEIGGVWNPNELRELTRMQKSGALAKTDEKISCPSLVQTPKNMDSIPILEFPYFLWIPFNVVIMSSFEALSFSLNLPGLQFIKLHVDLESQEVNVKSCPKKLDHKSNCLIYIGLRDSQRNVSHSNALFFDAALNQAFYFEPLGCKKQMRFRFGTSESPFGAGDDSKREYISEFDEKDVEKLKVSQEQECVIAAAIVVDFLRKAMDLPVNRLHFVTGEKGPHAIESGSSDWCKNLPVINETGKCALWCLVFFQMVIENSSVKPKSIVDQICAHRADELALFLHKYSIWMIQQIFAMGNACSKSDDVRSLLSDRAQQMNLNRIRTRSKTSVLHQQQQQQKKAVKPRQRRKDESENNLGAQYNDFNLGRTMLCLRFFPSGETGKGVNVMVPLGKVATSTTHQAPFSIKTALIIKKIAALPGQEPFYLWPKCNWIADDTKSAEITKKCKQAGFDMVPVFDAGASVTWRELAQHLATTAKWDKQQHGQLEVMFQDIFKDPSRVLVCSMNAPLSLLHKGIDTPITDALTGKHLQEIREMKVFSSHFFAPIVIEIRQQAPGYKHVFPVLRLQCEIPTCPSQFVSAYEALGVALDEPVHAIMQKVLPKDSKPFNLQTIQDWSCSLSSADTVFPIVSSSTDTKSPILRDVCSVLPHESPTVCLRFSGPPDFSNLTTSDKFASQLEQFMRSVPVEARKRAQAKTMRFLIKDLSQLLWSLMYVSRNSPKRLNLVVSCKPKALSALWNNCITGVDGKKSQEFANSLAIFGFHDHVTRWFEFIRQGKVSGPEVSELPELMKTLFLLPDGTIRSGLELFLQQVREFKYADPQQTIDLFVFQKQQINFLDMTDCYMLHLN